MDPEELQTLLSIQSSLPEPSKLLPWMSLPIGSAQHIKGLDSLEEQLLLLTTLFLEENPLPTFLLAQLNSTLGSKLLLHIL